MNFDFHVLNDSEKELIQQPDDGLLRVAVPHWAAQVQIYDHSFQPVRTVGVIKSNSQNLNVSETALKPGTYQVEVTLDGKTESEWIPVRSNRVTQTSQPETWQDLKMTTSAPLLETATKHEWHTNPAEEWSRKITWPNAPGGDSRLFLFVRTLQPKKYRNFYEGLILLDAEGSLVTDFSSGVEMDHDNGWLAFNADLPPGGYILRRGRRGVRLRHQPIYLCQNQETQIFLISEKYPTPRTLTLNMAYRGRGFSADSETDIAAEAVLSSLNYGTSHRQIAMSEKMDRLLEEKIDNSWLGIVAAYALILAQEETGFNVDVASKSIFTDRQKIDRLFDKVLSFLQAEIGDHPDVRALSLRESEPPAKPFAFPPLLNLGVRRIHRHSTRFADTIPLNSLTDCLLDNLLNDSPWTAWRKLDRLPQFGESKDFISEKKVSLLKVKPATTSNVPLTNIIPPNAPIKAPVFQMPGSPPEVDEQTVRLDSLLKQFVVELTESGELDHLPERKDFYPDGALINWLNTTEPTAISQSSGLPLSRIESGVENLRNKNYETFEFDKKMKPETAFTQTAIQNAFWKTEKRKPNDPGEPTLSVEECANKIHFEAERLFFYQTEVEDTNFGIKNLAERLWQVVEKLLMSADFAALTHPKRGIFSLNIAFQNLLMLPIEFNPNSQKTLEKARKKKLLAWGKVLSKSPLGESSISVQTGETVFNGKLRRTAIYTQPRNELCGHLNFFRKPDAFAPKADVLRQIIDLTSNLSLYTTILSYGSIEKKDEYFHELTALTEQLEKLTEI